VKLRPIAAVLALFAGAAAATTYELDLSEIPAEFHGSWDLNSRSCGAGAGGTRLEVSAAQLRFGADRFKVSGVSILEDRYIGISSDHVGPGKPWGRTDHFTLSSDGATLVARRGGRTVTRRRCHASRPRGAGGPAA
jgi:hypothetical protein